MNPNEGWGPTPPPGLDPEYMEEPTQGAWGPPPEHTSADPSRPFTPPPPEGADQIPPRESYPFLEYWGSYLAPVEELVVWDHVAHTVRFHILTGNELTAITDLAEQYPERHRSLVKGLAKLAYAVEAVNGKLVTLPFEAKLMWIAGHPETLLDALWRVYDIASIEPQRLLKAKLDDPNIGAVR